MSIVEKIRDAGIVGCGGAGFPTHAKLKGNIEYLMYLKNSDAPTERPDDEILKALVEQSHEDLKKTPVL